MAKFRKKPIEVEAVQMPSVDVLAFVGEDNLEVNLSGQAFLWVGANQTWLPLDADEWVIKDSKGFYPCKADIFEATYEPVSD